jgi:solute carrier family 12 sodium/potassium/chloride transporter 2
LGFGIEKIDELQAWIRKKGIFCSGTSISVTEHNQAILAAIQVLQGAFFRPNIALISTLDLYDEHSLSQIVDHTRAASMGMILGCETELNVGKGGVINVWIRAQEPHWEIGDAQAEGNLDLSLLLAIQLAQQHKMQIRLLTMIQNPAHYSLAEDYIQEIIELGRLPKESLMHISKDDFWLAIQKAPDAQLQIFGFPNTGILKFIDQVQEKSSCSNLFVRSSGIESILL